MFFIALVNLQLNSTVFFLLTINRPLTGHKSHLRIPVFWWFFLQTTKLMGQKFPPFFLQKAWFLWADLGCLLWIIPLRKGEKSQELEKNKSLRYILFSEGEKKQKKHPPPQKNNGVQSFLFSLPLKTHYKTYTQPFKNEHVPLKKGDHFKKRKYIIIVFQAMISGRGKNPSLLVRFSSPSDQFTVTHLDLGSPLSLQHVPLDKSLDDFRLRRRKTRGDDDRGTGGWWCFFFVWSFYSSEDPEKTQPILQEGW